MHKIPEKFYTSFKAPYTLYSSNSQYIEVFVNPTVSELKEIDSFPLAKFVVGEDNKVYFFNSDSLHMDTLPHLDVKAKATGDFNFAKKDFYVYDQKKGFKALMEVPYLKMRFTGFEIRDYSLTSKVYGMIK